MIANMAMAGALLFVAAIAIAHGGIWGLAFMFLAMASMAGGVADAA